MREIIDKNDDKMISLFESCELTNAEANCLCYLLMQKNGMSSDIEKTMKMSQSEVSVGMRDLLKKDFVSYTKVPRNTKGRPLHIYKINSLTNVHDKLKSMLKDMMKKIVSKMNDIDMLFSELESNKQNTLEDS